jgi:pimeloyl-ACP methyl ester carboxylesterase
VSDLGEQLRVDTGEVSLDVVSAGPSDGRPLLLIAGLGSQRTEWPAELLLALHDAGVRTTTFDNRDAGRSTSLDDRPGDAEDLQRWLRGEPFAVPYTLDDLAGDALAVLDAVGLTDAHVLGRSMGGMVAQRLALRAPQRVRSLTSLMATTGAADVGQPWPDALAAMTDPTPETRAEVIEAGVARARITNSPTLFDEARVRARLEASYDRSHRPEGTTRQLLAILADGDRTEALRSLRVPTLVLHGAADALVDVSGGRATAAAIPGARLVVFDEMGHDLPLPLLPQLVDEVVRHLHAAERDRAADAVTGAAADRP